MKERGILFYDDTEPLNSIVFYTTTEGDHLIEDLCDYFDQNPNSVLMTSDRLILDFIRWYFSRSLGSCYEEIPEGFSIKRKEDVDENVILSVYIPNEKKGSDKNGRRHNRFYRRR